jgi:hypothetical protein
MLTLLLGACGDNPIGPSPVLSCPTAQSVQSPSGSAVAVNYPAPTLMGGTAPVTTTCTPPSGSSFALGATTVTCTAQDSDQRRASCTFQVSVTRPPQLTATKFMAFGDSITSGKLVTDCTGGGAGGCRLSTQRLLRIGFDDPLKLSPRFGEESSAAYPRVLQAMLASRYSTQSIAIPNLGNLEVVPARKDAPTIALNRFAAGVAASKGANDMTPANPPIDAIVNDSRAMVRDARIRGVRVFIGNVASQREGACRGYELLRWHQSHPCPPTRRSNDGGRGSRSRRLHQGFDGQTSYAARHRRSSPQRSRLSEDGGDVLRGDQAAAGYP